MTDTTIDTGGTLPRGTDYSVISIPVTGGNLLMTSLMQGNTPKGVSTTFIGTSGGGGQYLPLTGGTVTGPTTFSSTTTHTGAATFNGGVSFGGGIAGSTIDLSKHIALFGTAYGANVTSGTLNLVAGAAATMQLTSGGAAVNGTLTITGRTSLLGITQTATILGANLGTPAGTGFTQNAAVAGTYANPSYLGINQWNVSSDLGALTGNLLFNTAINYNFGGGAFTGNRGGLLVYMKQTGAAAGTSGGGSIEVIHGQISVTNTFGGTDTGPGVAGYVFAANLYTVMTGGASNLVGTVGLEIDVEAQTGATYQAASGLLVVATGAHQAAGALGNNVAIHVGGGSNSLGFDTAYQISSWGLTSSGTVFRAEAAPDMPIFNINKGFDLRPITFAADIFAASGFAVGPTGRVRVGTGYFDITGTGAALSVDGAICTAGTLTAAVATTYPMDANFYFADDPYGGYWRVTFTVGTSSLTGLTLLLAGVVKGTPPANPITLTPRGRLNIFGPGVITANLTWNTSRTTLALQPTTGGAITMPALQASTTFANDAAAATGGVAVGGLYRNGSVIQIRVT